MPASVQKIIIPTYVPGADESNPMFYRKRNVQGASGKVFPMAMNSTLGEEKRDVEYESVRLENEYLAITLLPQLGGKIYRAFDKAHDYDFIYYNRVIKPALIGNCGPWTSGGIEFNWPQHHRPTTYLPVEYMIENNPDGSATCWMGETEPMTRMRGRVGVTIYPGRSYMQAKIRLYNRSDLTQSFMWWANLAVAVNKDYRAVFPPDIHWASDHAWAVTTPFPIVGGDYKGVDLGAGVDVQDYNNLPLSCSFFTYNSKYDFLAGYDYGRDSGTVHIADRHVSPGKKMFSWGTAPFAQAWYAKLTDEDGPYIELMTGVFSRNQPDFSWIAPHEYKTTDQYWYPIHGIGAVKNATLDAALAVDINDSDIAIGLNVTGVFQNVEARVTLGDAVLLSETLAYLRPGDVYKKELPRPTGAQPHEIRVAIYAGEKLLVDYQPEPPAEVDIPAPFEPTPEPKDVDSNEMLYLHALHLYQYRHPYLEPMDYIAEALGRDSGDARCNTLAANIALHNLDPKRAIEYATKAIERLTLRNPNPYDTEAYYIRGVAHMWRGEYDMAYEDLFVSTWRQADKSQSYALLSLISLRRGDYSIAIEHAHNAMLSGDGNQLALWALAVAARLTGDEARRADALGLLKFRDPMDVLYHAELAMATRDFTGDGLKVCLDKPEYALDAAYRYMQAGLYDDAAALLAWQRLNARTEFAPLTYALGYAYGKMGQEYDKQRIYLQAAAQDTKGVLHSRPEVLLVLSDVINTLPTDAAAPYYLGNIYNAADRFDEAAEMFEMSIARGAKFPTVYRNLAQIIFYRGDDARVRAGELMEKAFRLDRHDACVFYELTQYQKQTGAPVRQRIDLFEKFIELTRSRDDVYTSYIEANIEAGDYEKAQRLLAEHEFNSYEGGEGVTMRLHSRAYALDGLEHLAKGEYEKALQLLERATQIDANYKEGVGAIPRELSHIYYWQGLAKKAAGDTKGARAAFEQGAACTGRSAGVTDMLFRALNQKALRRTRQAGDTIAEATKRHADAVREAGKYHHFPKGRVSYLPFESDKADMDERANAFDDAWLRQLSGDANAFAEAARRYPTDYRLRFAAEHIEYFGV